MPQQQTKEALAQERGPRSLAIHFTMDSYNDQGTKDRKQSQFCSISLFNCFQWEKIETRTNVFKDFEFSNSMQMYLSSMIKKKRSIKDKK
jgi:hypothetical protein